jgi:hypothetical protein
MTATEKGMRLFAEEVVPALKQLRPEPLTVNGRATQTPMSEQQPAK